MTETKAGADFELNVVMRAMLSFTSNLQFNYTTMTLSYCFFIILQRSNFCSKRLRLPRVEHAKNDCNDSQARQNNSYTRFFQTSSNPSRGQESSHEARISASQRMPSLLSNHHQSLCEPVAGICIKVTVV